MRFQLKPLLVGIAVIGAGALGYAAAHGMGQSRSAPAASHSDATASHGAEARADARQHDHADHGHDHPAQGHADRSHEHPAQGHADHSHEHPAQGHADQSHEHPAHDHADPSHEHSANSHAGQGHGHSAHGHADQSPVAQKNVLGIAKPAASADTYTCPMHPSIITNAPGSCPICGMHLVKVVQGESGQNSDQVHVDAQTQQRMGVQMRTAAVAGMHRSINTFATIAPDQTRSVSVSSFVEGWIKRWHVQGVGQTIKKGQVLYEIYSPDLQQRQREYINLLTRLDAMQANGAGMGMSGGKSVDMSGPSFVMMRALAKDRFRARDRLLAAGIPAKVLEQLEQNRRIQDVVPIHATQDGVVTEVSAREGSYINPQQPLLVYTDNSRVWAEVTLYPDQIGWLRNGNDITLTSGLDATTQIRSHVDLSTLQIDPASRTAKLRLPISNTGNAFYPGSYAKATIKADERQVLSVPRDAVIRTGHGQYVVVNESPNHFRSAPVDTGIENAHSVEIRSGLEAGTSVVINGQFLLDAAASLQSMQGRLAAASIHAGHGGDVATADDATADVATADVATADATANVATADIGAAPRAVPIASAMPAPAHSHAHP